jgi:hypothetical protein
MSRIEGNIRKPKPLGAALITQAKVDSIRSAEVSGQTPIERPLSLPMPIRGNSLRRDNSESMSFKFL